MWWCLVILGGTGVVVFGHPEGTGVVVFGHPEGNWWWCLVILRGRCGGVWSS